MYNNPQKLADEYASPGTLKYYLLQLGFMPDNEDVAEALLKSLCEESDQELEDNYGLTASQIKEMRRRNE